MTDYENGYRAVKIKSGQLFQDFVVDLFITHLGMPICIYGSREYQFHVGESRQGVEIKNDQRYAQTGNLYIEYAEKAVPRPGPYVKSGIDRSDNTWLYVIGDYDTVFVFSKTILKGIRKRYRQVEIKLGTSKGFLLPDCDARKYAEIILTPNKSEIVSKCVKDLDQISRELHKELLEDGEQMKLF